jgi:hypothetical protein
MRHGEAVTGYQLPGSGDENKDSLTSGGNAEA